MENTLDQIVLQAPNFVGFIIGYLMLARVIQRMQDQHDKLITAIIKRENCEDTQDK